MCKLTPVLILAVGLWLSCPANAQQAKPPSEPQPQPALEPIPAQQPGAANQPGEAQPPAGTQQPGATDQTQPTRKPADFTLILLMFGALLVMIIFSSRSKRKQEAKRKEMLAALKKGDKVTSIGGIIGTIMDVRDDEVVVKVDESSNTRMRFARWAIRGIGEQAAAEEEKK